MLVRPKTLATVALATSVAWLVTGCGGGDPAASSSPSARATASGTPSPSASPSKTAAKVTPSTDLKMITVSGDAGKAPRVTVKAPWAVDKTRTEVLQPGQGGEVTATSSVTVDYYGVNGRTGKKFDDSFSRGAPATFPLDGVVAGFKKGLVGQKQGSRVLVAMPGSDGYDASGGSPQAGIEVGDTLIFVIDIVAVPLTGPEGADVEPRDGLPTVTDAKGVPTVKMPGGNPPKDLVVQPLIKGTGPKVAATDTVTFNYRWYTWSGRLIEDSYQQPAGGGVPLAQLFQGLQKGLTGQTVGSRVLLVVPPALSYPNGNTEPKIEKTDTQVLVVDLLFTEPTQ